VAPGSRASSSVDGTRGCTTMASLRSGCLFFSWFELGGRGVPRSIESQSSSLYFSSVMSS
jgi:hypothetical protein